MAAQIATWTGGLLKDALVILMWFNGLPLSVGCFMDVTAAMILLIPVLIPVVEAAHINWYIFAWSRCSV